MTSRSKHKPELKRLDGAHATVIRNLGVLLERHAGSGYDELTDEGLELAQEIALKLKSAVAKLGGLARVQLALGGRHEARVGQIWADRQRIFRGERLNPAQAA